MPALQQAIDAVFDARIGDISGRGKLAADMREIWMMQPRFERRHPGSASTLVEQPRFRAGFDFLVLRAQSGEIDAETADWWQEFQQADTARREAMLLADTGEKRKRRPRRRGRKTADEAPAAEEPQ